MLQGIEADEQMLRGVALSEPEDQLRFFPADALPTKPAERFAAIFAARPRWAAADIAAYLEGMQVNDLLFARCRSRMHILAFLARLQWAAREYWHTPGGQLRGRKQGQLFFRTTSFAQPVSHKQLDCCIPGV